MKKLGWHRRTRRRPYRDFLVGLALLVPCLVVVLLFFAYPLVGVFVRSVSDPAPGVGNYVEIVSSRAFRNILRLTVEVSVVTTVGCLILGFPVAWYITTLEKRRAQLFLVLSTAPLWVAILARLYAWTVILGRRGLINDSLAAMGAGSRTTRSSLQHSSSSHRHDSRDAAIHDPCSLLVNERSR